MARVAIVTESIADLSPDVAAASGIRVVPLLVTFGDEEFRAGVDLSMDQFWQRMLAPGAPWPRTAAAAPGVFAEVYEERFADGADAVVCVTASAKLSAANQSAEMAARILSGREVHVVDSGSASMGEEILALLGAQAAEAGASGAEVAALMRDRATDLDLYVALDTLEYLRKGGRIGAAKATLGTVLSVKPIITIRDGAVETVETPRTRTRARERVLDLLTRRPVEWIAILHTPGGGPRDLEAFKAEVLARLPGGVDPGRVSLEMIGASVGPHVGPGCLGAVMLLRH